MSEQKKLTNLEAICAQYGSQVVEHQGRAKSLERLQKVLRNALGVMREDGLFAFYLYLQYQKKDDGGVIWEQISRLWRDESVGPLLGSNTDRQAVIELTNDLDSLLLARQVAEQTLIYALYGLRAGG